MTTEERILLILSGVLTIAPLLMLFYRPTQADFAIPLLAEVLLYIGIGTTFLLFVQFRKNARVSLVFIWILAGFTALAAVLLALTIWTAA